MVDWEEMEMSKMTLRFLAWATGWRSSGTLEEFGVGGDHDFNLRRKKISWWVGSSMSGLQRVRWVRPSTTTPYSFSSVISIY